jgi:hypothetical protein
MSLDDLYVIVNLLVVAQFQQKLTWPQSKLWNPALGAKCTNLFANYYVCVGKILHI